MCLRYIHVLKDVLLLNAVHVFLIKSLFYNDMVHGNKSGTASCFRFP